MTEGDCGEVIFVHPSRRSNRGLPPSSGVKGKSDTILGMSPLLGVITTCLRPPLRIEGWSGDVDSETDPHRPHGVMTGVWQGCIGGNWGVPESWGVLPSFSGLRGDPEDIVFEIRTTHTSFMSEGCTGVYCDSSPPEWRPTVPIFRFEKWDGEDCGGVPP